MDCKTVIPPVENSDVESTFDVTHTDDGSMEITATISWEIEPDATVWSGLTYDEIQDGTELIAADNQIEIIREVGYRSREDHYDNEKEGWLGVYISQHCDVPDVQGVHADKKYSYEIPDPWLFDEGDHEEFSIVNGHPHERKGEYVDEDSYEMEWFYVPLYDHPLGRMDVQTFVNAHHFGKLPNSPTPVEQIEDVLNWRNPDAITLEEYKAKHVDSVEPAIAD